MVIWLNGQYPFLPLHLIIEPWYHLRYLALLHTATCIKNTRTHAKLQKVNSHENQPCGTALVTTPDQGLEPFYKLIQQDQRRRYYVWGRGLLLWTPACEGNCQIVTCIILWTRELEQTWRYSKIQKFWISPWYYWVIDLIASWYLSTHFLIF